MESTNVSNLNNVYTRNLTNKNVFFLLGDNDRKDLNLYLNPFRNKKVFIFIEPL